MQIYDNFKANVSDLPQLPVFADFWLLLTALADIFCFIARGVAAFGHFRVVFAQWLLSGFDAKMPQSVSWRCMDLV